MKIDVFTGLPKVRVTGYNDERIDIYSPQEKLFIGNSPSSGGAVYASTGVTKIQLTDDKNNDNSLYIVIIIVVLLIVLGGYFLMK